MTSPALAEVSRLLDRLIDELHAAKSEVSPEAVEPLIFARAEVKVARRRLRNLRKALGSRGDL